VQFEFAVEAPAQRVPQALHVAEIASYSLRAKSDASCVPRFPNGKLLDAAYLSAGNCVSMRTLLNERNSGCSSELEVADEEPEKEQTRPVHIPNVNLQSTQAARNHILSKCFAVTRLHWSIQEVHPPSRRG